MISLVKTMTIVVLAGMNSGAFAQDSTPDHTVDLCDASYANFGNAQFKVAVKGNLYAFPWPGSSASHEFFTVKYQGDGILPDITYFDPVPSGFEGSVAFTDDFLIYSVDNADDPVSGDRTGVSVVYELDHESGDLTESVRLYPATPGYDNTLLASRPPLDSDSDHFVFSINFSSGNLNRTSVYAFDGSSWSLDGQIDRSSSAVVLSVAIEDGLLVIAYSDGQVDVYERGASSWTYQDSISPITHSDITASSNFGFDTDIHGTLIAVSDRFAEYDPSDPSIDARMGACYIYSYNSGSVSDETVLYEYSGSTGSESLFGNSIDFADDGSALVVGAPAFDRTANTYYEEGAAFVYDTSNFGAGGEMYTDSSHDQYSNNIFGETVTFSGNALNIFNTKFDLSVFGACTPSGNGIGISIFDALSIMPCNDADLTQPYGQLDFYDVSAFLVAYSAMDPIADWDSNGSYDFFDVAGFLGDFNTGCP